MRISDWSSDGALPIWPMVDPAHVGKSGTAWQIFPNFQIGHAVNNALCYNFKPHSDDPNKCCFEVAVYELFAKGEEPKTEWEYRSEEHTSELQSLMRTSYAVFCFKTQDHTHTHPPIL